MRKRSFVQAAIVVLTIGGTGCVRGGFTPPTRGVDAWMDDRGEAGVADSRRNDRAADHTAPDRGLGDKGSPGDKAAPDAPLLGPFLGKVTGSHATCATAATIDLSALATGPVHFQVNTAGVAATSPKCGGLAGVFIHVINAPAKTPQAMIGCWSGGGSFSLTYRVTDNQCAFVTGGFGTAGGVCDGAGGAGFGYGLPDFYALACRDALAGTATVRVW